MTPFNPRAFALALAVLALLTAAACSDGDEPSPAPAETQTATASPAAAAPTATPTAAAPRTATPPPSATPPVAATTAPRATPPTDPPPSTAPPPPPAAPGAGERSEPAPIEAINVIWSDTPPRQYWVEVTSGLPNGCARFAGIQLARAGTTITLTVTNLTSASPSRACTQLYGYASNTVYLGTDFVSGTRYTIRANDKQETFTAP